MLYFYNRDTIFNEINEFIVPLKHNLKGLESDIKKQVELCTDEELLEKYGSLKVMVRRKIRQLEGCLQFLPNSFEFDSIGIDQSQETMLSKVRGTVVNNLVKEFRSIKADESNSNVTQ